MPRCPPENHHDRPTADPAVAARIARAQAVLHELTELGLRFARLMADQAEARPAPETDAELRQSNHETTVAYERLTRAIRRNLALGRALDEPQASGPTLFRG